MALFNKEKGTANVVIRSLVSLELAKVTVIQKEKAQKQGSGL